MTLLMLRSLVLFCRNKATETIQKSSYTSILPALTQEQRNKIFQKRQLSYSLQRQDTPKKQ